MTMQGNTIKTLAEYIAKMNQKDSERFEEYANNQFDTNGVEQDYIETFWPPEDIRSRANP